MKLYLIRHGETDWNKEGRLQGRRDIPMNDGGIAQSGRIGERLRDILYGGAKTAGDIQNDEGFPDILIVSSPLRRARMCAEVIADQLNYARENIRTEPLLIERSFGVSEGEIWQPEMREHEKENQWEDMDSLLERARAGIEKYINRNEQVVIIAAHGAILKAVLAVLANESLAHGDNNSAVKQGTIVEVEYEQGEIGNLSEITVN